MDNYNQIDILVNNAGVQYESTSLQAISTEQFDKTFKTNVYGAFYMTKGSLTAFTRSLALALANSKSGIRVNAVAPGPIWTPFIPSSFNSSSIPTFGTNTPLGRAGQPIKCAGAYVFLASNAASYMSGQTIHVNA